jgi:NADH-quinone oxidoreductase subunit N
VGFYELIDALLSDTVGVSLWAFRPELLLCATIVLILLARVFLPRWQTSPWYLAMAGVGAALVALMPWLWQSFVGLPEPLQPQPIFTGMLLFDSLSVFMRALLMVAVLMVLVLAQITNTPPVEDAAEFCILVLGAALGMCLMVAANHMLAIFLGMEMASVPCYVLAGVLRHRRSSTEAALKYAVFGAAASGVMLYGISLLVGAVGSAHLPTMVARLAAMLQNGPNAVQTSVLVLGSLMLLVGLAFKLSAVPFHYWTPDVFEGAPAEIGGFLSVASKAAALALLMRLVLVFGGGMDETTTSVLLPVRQYLAGLLTLLAAVTCTFGNLAAYGQTNMKRLLAYSTIAHAGYLLMPAAALAAAATPHTARGALAAAMVYLTVYLFMNLGAFACVAFLRNTSGSEEIASYAGLVRRSPGLTVCAAIILFSLVGLPPLAGFAAKFAIFAALVDAQLYLLLAIGGLNTVLGLFYYLGVVKVMVLSPEPPGQPAATLPLWSLPGAYCALVTLPLMVLLLRYDSLWAWAWSAAAGVVK